MRYTQASIDERRTLPPSVAVSTVAFALHPPSEARIESRNAAHPNIWIPLVRRTRAPFRGSWALPGGPTQWDETLTDTALRSVRSAVLRDPGYLEQLYSFGGVERSAQAQRLVTIAYWALYGEAEIAQDVASSSEVPPATGNAAAASDVSRAVPTDLARAAQQPRRWDDAPVAPRADAGVGEADTPAVDNVAWFTADGLPELAFDHAEIVAVALARLRAKTSYSTVAVRFLGPTFTLGRLRAVTEAVLGRAVDPANFRRQALAQGALAETGEVESGTRHRPAKLYRFVDTTEPERTVDSPNPRSTP